MIHSDLAGFIRRQHRPAALFLTVWTVFAAMEVAKDWYTASSAGWAFSPGRHIVQSAFIFYPWFIISLLIGAIAWYQPQTLIRIKGYAIHLLLAVTIGLLHLLLVVASFWIFFPGRMVNSSVTDVFVEQLLSWLHFEILVYFAVLLVWRAMLQPQQAREGNRTDHRQKIVGRIDGEVHIAPLELVDWIEGAGNNVIAHTGERNIRVRETLKNLESRLDKHRFVRVHRSAMINLDRVRCISDSTLVMSNGNQVTCSRSGKKALRQLLADSSSPT